ncbi:transposase [Streptosporangium sp. NBC_01495]|nr:transposase [Streptosporangium sp. NBC_01495]
MLLGPRKGRTLVLPVAHRDRGRVSIAALICVKPGMRTRLIYRTRTRHHRKNEPKGFTVADLQRLLQAAHTQLGGPISLVWDSLPEHVSTQMRAWIAAQQDWLLVYRFPAYAPDLNPAESVWSNLRTKLFNFTAHSIDDLARLIKNRLKPLQYRPDLLNGFIAETGIMIPDPT